MTSIAEAMQSGLAHHRAGRLREAEQSYRQVLTAQPQHAGALHMLGVVALQAGRPDLAVQYISDAIRVDGGQATFHANLGEALRALGRLDDARRSYEQAIRLQPKLAAAHNNLGTILERLGDRAAAIECYGARSP